MSAPATAELNPVAPEADLPLWLGLVLTPNLGLRGIHKLLTEFLTPGAIYAASLTSLEACGIAVAAAQHLNDGRSLELGNREADLVGQQGVQVVTLAHRAYPELLREIHDPPPLLYVRGRVESLDSFSIAVVGTRRPTIYGRLMAETLGRDLANWGLTIVSGLARGIDALAQKACVEAGGCTVAVMGTGVDIIYPRENAALAESILRNHGALISEFPIGAFPAAQNFPIRNRVISGLALGVLVVEGGEYSGSRITARMALEQNRDVYCVPGMVTQKQAWLPNALIKQGAKLVSEVADIIEELPSSVRGRLVAPEVVTAASGSKRAEVGSVAAQHQLILGVLQVEESAHVDEIGNRLENRLSAPEVLALLFDLELEGRVRQLPGKHYLRVH